MDAVAVAPDGSWLAGGSWPRGTIGLESLDLVIGK
jgi:hypothetical protein